MAHVDKVRSQQLDTVLERAARQSSSDTRPLAILLVTNLSGDNGAAAGFLQRGIEPNWEWFVLT